MTHPPVRGASISRLDRAALHRLAAVTVLGFASGLPLALTGQAMQAWLGGEGVGLATIGFLSLVGLPYTFKFLWAPLMDRFELPWLGRRRGWLVVTQLGLAGALAWLAATPPAGAIVAFALLAGLVAFLSASQDVVSDAYKVDLLPAGERGLGSSLNVVGYRLAMIVSGGIALIWVDPVQGSGWSWPEVYRLMAMLMVGAALISATLLPRIADAALPASVARNDVVGFFAVVAAVAVGYLVTDYVGRPIAKSLAARFAPVASVPSSPAVAAPRAVASAVAAAPAGVAPEPTAAIAAAPGAAVAAAAPAAVAPTHAAAVVAPIAAVATDLPARWLDLGVLLFGVAITLPLAAWAARAARFETLLGGLRDYFRQSGAAAFLAFIVLYKLGDAFAGSLMTPFLLQGMQYGPAEVGVVNKVIGLWLTIGGAIVGGAMMLRLGLWRSLFVFGLLQMASNLGFWWLAVGGRGMLPGLVIPAFDWGFVKLVQATPVDGGLLLVIAGENISSGMGTAAFVAFLMSLCNRRFSATQFALLSAFASVGRVWVGPLAGVLVLSIGWPTFFIASTLAALPALALLVALRAPIAALTTAPGAVGASD